MSTIDFTSYLAEQLAGRSVDSGRRVRTTAETLRTVAEQLRSDPTTHAAASLADRGAELMDRVGSYLEETDVNAMVSDAERLSRERPWLVATVGVGLGLLAARLVKSTAARRP